MLSLWRRLTDAVLRARCDAFTAALARHVDAFREQAALSGRPGGLVWDTVAPASPPVFARGDDGSLIALVAIEVAFDAAEDGEMDDAPGLAMIRSATALFRESGRHWEPDPKAIFNMTPDDVLRLQPGWQQLF